MSRFCASCSSQLGHSHNLCIRLRQHVLWSAQTSIMETLSISANLWSTWIDNLCVFSVLRRFSCFREYRISSAINSVPPNISVYTSFILPLQHRGVSLKQLQSRQAKAKPGDVARQPRQTHLLRSALQTRRWGNKHDYESQGSRLFAQSSFLIHLCSEAFRKTCFERNCAVVDYARLTDCCFSTDKVIWNVVFWW